MATSSVIHLTPNDVGVFHVENIPDESIRTANQLLQANHEQYHIFFNDKGFHNHITHYMLTQASLAATPSQMRRGFIQEAALQRPAAPVDENMVQQLQDEAFFMSHLAQPQHYNNYLTFFERQIAQHGLGPVVYEYLFSRKPIAEALFSRMYASFLHPIIHFGFGVEFNQPAIIAESMAQCSIHQPEVSHFFKSVEAAESALASEQGSSMIDLINEVAQNDKIRNDKCWRDGSWIEDDPLTEAPEELWRIAAKWRVTPETLKEKTAEMINVNAYFTAAAQMPGKEYKLDFFLIHNVNCSIFFWAFLEKDWMRVEDKVRLLEWKGRFDIVAYASRGCAPLRSNDVINYRPRNPTTEWGELFKRANTFLDESHLSKLVRAFANGAKVSKPYGSNPAFPMTQSMFLQAAHIALDSTEDPYYKERWVRGAGFEQQWDKFKERDY